MLNEYKERKLAEWYKICESIEANKEFIDNRYRGFGKAFISDLIDDMESNLFLKYIVTKTRIDTLKKIIENLPNKSPDRGYNDCLWEIRESLKMKLEELTNNIKI